MKNVLTLLLLVIGTSAFANTGTTEPKPAVENHETTNKKAACKPVKAQETAAAKPAAGHKEKHGPGTTKTCTTVEKASFGISGYFVDFIHNSNVKLVKLLIE